MQDFELKHRDEVKKKVSGSLGLQRFWYKDQNVHFFLRFRLHKFESIIDCTNSGFLVETLIEKFELVATEKH